jgi:hypothetical protein
MSGEFLQGLFWLFIGIAVTLFSSKYSMGTLTDPGPGALPFGLGLVFILLSILLLLRSRRMNEGDREVRLPFGSRYGRVLWVGLLLGVGTFWLENLGYLLVLFLLITGAMFIMEPRRWVSALTLGMTSSILSYLLFNVWLRVPLPRGWIYF